MAFAFLPRKTRGRDAPALQPSAAWIVIVTWQHLAVVVGEQQLAGQAQQRVGVGEGQGASERGWLRRPCPETRADAAPQTAASSTAPPAAGGAA